jgi:predicted lipid-binding transport protein (Tim44 family)
LSGGAVRSDLTQLYALPPSPGEVRPIAPLILALIILLLISEIAVRRWQISLPRWPRRTATPAVTSPTSSAAAKNSAATTTSATANKTSEPAVPNAPDKDRGLHEALRHLRDKRKS